MAMASSKAAPVGIEANNESNGTEAEGPECRNCGGGGGWGMKMGMNSWSSKSNNKWDNKNDWDCPECDFIPAETDICDWKPDIEDCDIDVICADEAGQEIPGQGKEEE